MTAAQHSTPPLHGPYDDDTTARQAQHAADAIRYLNYATRNGLTEPNTAAILAAHLADAAHRLPQLLTQVADWLCQETAAGRIADDHHHTQVQLTDSTRATLTRAATAAEQLATALDTAHNLTAYLHTTA
jgi:hypothetical protein